MLKVVLILTVFFSHGMGGEEKIACPPFFENIAERCYFFSSTMGGSTMSWHAARDYCHALSTGYDTELAVMGHSCVEDEAFLSAVALKGISAAWVGASALSQPGVWSWLDGRAVDLSSHSWDSARPSGSSYTKCAQVALFQQNGRMYLADQNCETLNQYICETNVTTLIKN